MAKAVCGGGPDGLSRFDDLASCARRAAHSAMLDFVDTSRRKAERRF